MKLDDGLKHGDNWQRSHRVPAVGYGVIKKFGDDKANQYVVALGWYGFLAIYPLLLIIVTVFGFIGAASLGRQLVAALHQFPIVGSEFNPAHGGRSLHGTVLGMVIGLIGLLYGAQGVTQTAQEAMVQVWNIPQLEVPGFLQRLVRSLAGLAIIGGTFLVNAALATLVTGGGPNSALRVSVLIGMALVNIALYGAAFRSLTPSVIPSRALIPGAAVAAIGFTGLITVGNLRAVRHRHRTGGFFAVVGQDQPVRRRAQRRARPEALAPRVAK
jgi:uncharacterized BrkB/YihY/UPF0761 family membrane protein